MEPPTAGSTVPRFGPLPAGVDIELTSRCNASCSFCPRDQTPHQGLIDERTFTAALERAVQYRDAVLELHRLQPGYLSTVDDTIFLSFCGMGEPLLHPRVVEYVRRAAEAGLRPIINTNGALLSPDKAEDLMAAGLAMVCLNVGEIGEQYEEVYDLPFERTRFNVEHFLAAAPGRCLAVIVLVDHWHDPDHATSVREYWSERGASAFLPFTLVNRAGALALGEDVEDGQAFLHEAEKILAEGGGETGCWAPFMYPFIGYDGNYYLCSSDWRKEVNLGNVFERSVADLIEDKVERVRSRSPICRDCTHDPTNTLARALAAAVDVPTPGAPPEPATATDEILAKLDHFSGCLSAMRTHLPRASDGRGPVNRRLIPVRS